MGIDKFDNVFDKIYAGDLAQARKLLKPLIQKEADPDALFLLGLVRMEGRQTVAAQEAAFKSFKEAASQGHVFAKYFAARAYLEGSGVTKNRGTGIRWLEDCAAQGCASASQHLGIVHLEPGKYNNNDKAIAFLTKAASHPGMEFDGCSVVLAGCSSPQEFVELHEAEAIACAQEYLACLYSGQDDGIPRNPALAAQWAAKAVANSFDELTWPLITIYLEIGNHGEAKTLLLRLTKQNDFRAMYELAQLYEKSGSKEERDQVYRLYIEARKGGYPGTTPVKPFSFPMPKARPGNFLHDVDVEESEWPAMLAEAAQCRMDDPHGLAVAVRIYHRLARGECPEAEMKISEIRTAIGDFSYLRILKFVGTAN